jgi:hypothetical protein
VNRWRRWAGDLRRRHGRRAGTGPSREMALLRRCVAIAPAASVRARTIVNLHAPIAITWLPASAVPASRPASLDRSPAGAFRRLDWITAAAAPPPATAAPAAAMAPVASAATAPAFVRAAALCHLRARPAASRPQPGIPARALPAPLALTRPSRGTADAAADVVNRLTRRATREELPVHTRPTTLAPSPVAIAAAAARAASAASSAAAPASWVPPQAPPAAIDVTALTSQVMQQIDRRLIAYRERMGRV